MNLIPRIPLLAWLLLGQLVPVAMALPPATNDDLSQAITLPSELPTGDEANAENASAQSNEPTHAGLPPRNSLWWRWTPAEDQLVELSLSGSDFNTVAAVYTGNSFPTLSPVASADQPYAFNSGNPRLRFFAQAGTNYAIAVDGTLGSNSDGDVKITLTRRFEGSELLPFRSPWEYLLPVDAYDQPVDPQIADLDFHQTWHHPQSYSNEHPFVLAQNGGIMGYGNINANPGVVTDIWEGRDHDDDGQPDATPPAGSRFTAWFRTSFVAPKHLDAIGFEGLFDDGAIIYVNGIEAARVNIDPTATDDWMLLAQNSSNTENRPVTVIATDLDIVAGASIDIGVSLHQANPNSSDIGFDLRAFAPHPLPGLDLDGSGGTIDTGFENAEPGDRSFRPAQGVADLAWDNAGTATIELESTFPNPPPTPGKALIAESDSIQLVTENLDISNAGGQVVVSIDLRTFEDSGGSDFEDVDYVHAWVEGSPDGLVFHPVATIVPELSGGGDHDNDPATPDKDDELKELEQANGAYTTFSSYAGGIPSNYQLLRVHIEAVNNSPSERFFVDNLRIETVPVAVPVPIDLQRLATGGATVTWETIPQATYRVEFSDDLLNWTAISPVIGPTSGTANESYDHTGPHTRAFYRVLRLP